MLRNFIEITGITPEGDLPDKITGQLVEYSEVEHIYIPYDKPRINSIYQISIEVAVNSSRTINAPLEKIVVLDGIKKLKILYTQRGHREKATAISLDLPYNTFIQLPKNCGDIEGVQIHIVDAYFKALDETRIYSYILYFVHVIYKKAPESDNSGKSFLNTISSENTENTNSFDYAKFAQQVMDEITISKVRSSDGANTIDTQLDLDSEYL